MSWFADCRTLEEVKAEYRRLCFEHHPDRGGSSDTMQAINTVYRRILAEGLAAPRAWTPPRPTWPQRPAPPADAGPRPSRAELQSQWQAASWQPTAPNQWVRRVGRYTVTLIAFTAGRQALWAIQVGGHLSMFAHETREQAEADGLRLLIEQLAHD